MIKKICLICGKEYYMKPSLNKSKYCSNKCYCKSRKLNPIRYWLGKKSPKRLNLDNIKIIDLYEGGKNILTISKIFNCSPSSIRTILKDENIKFRSLSESQKGRIPWNKGLTKEDPRVRKYCFNSSNFEKGHEPPVKKGENWDSVYGKEKAKEIKKKHHETKKELYASGKLIPWNKNKPFLAGEKNPMYGKTHPNKGKKGLWKHSEEIKKKYKLAKQNISETTRKKQSKTRKKLIKEGKVKAYGYGLDGRHFGKDNPTFNNWSSREPYGEAFSPELKEEIRKRDNYTCQECEKTKMELLENNYLKKLRIHHINYNKQDNNRLNLISLCLNCHSKTNYKRKHWKKYFQMKIFINELFNPQNILIFNEDRKLIGVDRLE